MVELIITAIVIPVVSYLYVRNFRTQPKISVKSGQCQIFRRQQNRKEKSVDIHWHLEFINNSSYDAHLISLKDLNGNSLVELIPIEPKLSISGSAKNVVKVHFKELVASEKIKDADSIEILRIALAERELAFKFYCEYENRFGAKFYSLVKTNDQEITTDFYISKRKMLRNA